MGGGIPVNFLWQKHIDRVSSHKILESDCPDQMQKVNPASKNCEIFRQKFFCQKINKNNLRHIYISLCLPQNLASCRAQIDRTVRVFHCTAAQRGPGVSTTSWQGKQFDRTSAASLASPWFNRYNLQNGGVANADEKSRSRSNFLSSRRLLELTNAYRFLLKKNKSGRPGHVVIPRKWCRLVLLGRMEPASVSLANWSQISDATDSSD